ncbi:MAG TPA: hypothetical protein DD381_08840 [Lentisphaeria bacterium]|nr:MAG: hypothetical protein A2X47_08015 [Lentisphaerae bacterium GWF2_38_69]HBM16429.1 hypothetical protein [Lentisphaeria bacterium]
MLYYKTVTEDTLELLRLLQRPWIASSIKEDQLILADKCDIAAMKLSAITNRGRRRILLIFTFCSKGSLYQKCYTFISKNMLMGLCFLF